MNVRTVLCVLTLVTGLGFSALAQEHTYLGLEGALCNDIYVLSDEGSSLERVPLGTALWGLNIRQDIDKRVFAEVSVLAKAYWEGFRFKMVPVWGSNQAFVALLIPAKVGYKIQIGRSFHVVSSAAITLGINTAPDIGAGGGRGAIRSDKWSIEYTYNETNLTRRYFLMVQPSLAIERAVFKVLVASLTFSRPIGFTIVNDFDIDYTINGSATSSGKATSRGDYWSLGLALRYRISNLWKKNPGLK